MPRLRLLASFASWNYGAQLLTTLVQFAYAAITTRLVDDIGFGQYAIALAVSGLITLIASGGLGQTVGRMIALTRQKLSALTWYAWGLGAVGALILFVTADVWAWLWGDADSSEVIRFLCVSVFVAPFLGLSTGLLRRQGRFRILAVTVFASNTLAMGLGLLAVYTWPGPIALLCSPVAAMILQSIISFVMNHASLTAKPDFTAARDELDFSWRVTMMNILAYLNLNIGRWGVARGIGVTVIGQWNRADVVTTVPLEQLQVAFQQAIYPEYRHDREGNERTQRVWTDLLIVVAWLASFTSCVAAFLVPILIPILFGPGWGLASQLSVPLALVAGLRMLYVTLAAALEATARFRWIVATHIVGILIHTLAAGLSIWFASLIPTLTALFIAIMVQHAIQVVLCSKNGLLNTRRLLWGYSQSLGFGLLLYGVLLAVQLVFQYDILGGIAFLLGLLLIFGFLTFQFGGKLPPMRIVSSYWRK